MRIFTILVVLGTLQSLHSYGADACKREFINEEKFGITVAEDCRVEVHPRGSNNRTRKYYFMPDGYLLAFIDTQDYATNSKATGARAYRIFPIHSSKPVVQKNSSGIFEIKTASGLVVKLRENGELESINGGAVKTQALEHIDALSLKKGGVDLRPSRSVILDYGWAKGGVAYRNLGASSIFYDERGRSCSVKNSEMYHANTKDPSDPRVKFQTPAEWKKFIGSACANLQWVDDAYPFAVQGAKKITENESTDPLGDLIRSLEEKEKSSTAK